MSKTLSTTTQTTDAPRVLRGAAGVIAQYIQDLSHPAPIGVAAHPSRAAAA